MSDALQALYEGDEERARRLLSPDGELSVFEAAAFGRDERLAEIVTGDPAQARTFSDDGFTALHLAVFGRQEEAARVLLEAGADPNVLATSSFAPVPPLGTAAFVRSVPLAQLLLDRGADPNLQGEGGFTALHAAAQNGDEELARLLLERGADPSLAAKDGRRPGDLGLAELLG
jgi:ankyrin repeat protein